MEAFKHLGITIKKNILKYLGLIFLFIILYNLFPNLLKKKPTEKELIGTYNIVTADNGIPKSKFKNYTLVLKENGTFEFTQTPGIKLCEKGNYELDYQFEDNEISFQCGKKSWSPKHLKRKLFGFEIEFYLDIESGKSICYAKTE